MIKVSYHVAAHPSVFHLIPFSQLFTVGVLKSFTKHSKPKEKEIAWEIDNTSIKTYLNQTWEEGIN